MKKPKRSFPILARELGGYFKEKWLDSFLISIPEDKVEEVKKNIISHPDTEKLEGIGMGFDYNNRTYTYYVKLKGAENG